MPPLFLTFDSGDWRKAVLLLDDLVDRDDIELFDFVLSEDGGDRLLCTLEPIRDGGVLLLVIDEDVEVGDLFLKLD